MDANSKVNERKVMASKLYNENGAELGRVLATGKGLAEMFEVCARNKWDDENTVLYVADTGDLNSKWKIYAIKGATV